VFSIYEQGISLNKLIPCSYILNTTGMAHLEIINARRGPIHEYENLKGDLLTYLSLFLALPKFRDNISVLF